MAGRVKFKFEGGKELQKALRALPDATAKNTVRRVLKKRAQPVADAARSKAPKDDGQLRDSIAVSTKLSKANRRDRKRFGRDDIEVFIGAGPLPQAHLQEFGSSRHKAQPFLRPAWDERKDGVLEGLKDDLWTEIRKAVERQRKKAAKAAAKGR